MLERLIHELLAREIGQPLLTLSILNKINLILILMLSGLCLQSICFYQLKSTENTHEAMG